MTRPKQKTLRKSSLAEKAATEWGRMPKHARKFYLDRKNKRHKNLILTYPQ
jgi:hypothetical protein